MADSNPYALPLRLAAPGEDLPLDERAFTPVLLRARRDGWSPECQRAIAGEVVPYYYRGRRCGENLRYSGGPLHRRAQRAEPALRLH